MQKRGDRGCVSVTRGRDREKGSVLKCQRAVEFGWGGEWGGTESREEAVG